MKTKTANLFRTQPVLQHLESRWLMSVSAVKDIDLTGPISQTISSGENVYVLSSHASGASNTQIWVTRGEGKSKNLLVNLNVTGATISSIDDLTVTSDGKVFFTANASTGGRQIFQVDTRNGGYKQISADAGRSYSTLAEAGGKLFGYDHVATEWRLINVSEKTTTLLRKTTLAGSVFSANNLMLFRDNDGKLWRSDGTAAGTYQLTPDNMSVTSRIFASGDFVYFEGRVGNLTSLFRTNGVSENLQAIANDFILSDTSHAELSGWTYFGGGYYNTAGHGTHGQELYRVRNSDGTIELAAEVSNDSSSYPTNIGVVANNIYFIARDGEFVQSQGTYDVELYRFDPSKNELKLVTKDNTLYPIGFGGGSLASYYFVSAPTKDDARWGSRSLYRTNPITDQIEEVAGVPNATNSNGVEYQNVRGTAVNSKGFFFWADTGVMGREHDMFFVATPFSNLRPDGTLMIDATKSSDAMSIKMDNGDLVVKLNGREERWDASQVSQINIALGAGDDKLTTDVAVNKRMYVFGDVGNDTITTGSGKDTITGGGGANRMFGGEGEDRITGSNGRDIADGQGGPDRIYGNGGGDDLSGGAGVDRIWGGEGDDILRGGSSNDKLYGEAGNDTLAGGSQNDWLVGGDGNDDLFGNIGIDTINGGAGTDRRENDASDVLVDTIESVKA